MPLHRSLVELRMLLGAGHLTATELVTAALEALARTQPTLNAFVAVHRARALAEAARPGGGPLAGVPIAVKDNLDEAGVPGPAGCRAYRDRIPPRDATAVARLRAAGAVIVGRTNMHELADGITSANPHHGPVRNPWGRDRHPGGSSGGSGAAVAAGVVPAALGTDTGGSVRIPAALCGVVGLKPTRGLVPTGGVVPLSPTLDHVGVLTRSVADAAALLAVLAPAAAEPLARPGRGRLRLGVLEGFAADADGPVGACFAAALRVLEGLGARLRAVSVPRLAEAGRLLGRIYRPEAARAHALQLAARPADFGAEVRATLERGLRADPAGREAALRERELLAAEVAAAMEDVDLLVSPTTPHPAGPLGAPGPATYLAFTCPFNLTGQPALSLPMGLVDGLPVGLQLAGRPGEDARLLWEAAALEERLGFDHSPAGRGV
ncbi:MAG TPA: amidase [Polyangia bacterium]|jgi:aspartyl-tRNA(Asn)/glutamyl-tRNA(Gln) amidotransferase subunit A